MKKKNLIRTAAFLAAVALCSSALPAFAEDVPNNSASETEESPIKDFTVTIVPDIPGTYTAQASELPASYDLREYGQVTSVKNQGQTETCWAHAALSSAESNMLKTGLAKQIMTDNHLTGELDLSESHLVWFGHCQYSEDPEDPLYHKGTNLGTDGYMKKAAILDALAALASGVGVELEGNQPAVAEKASIAESERYHSYALLQNMEIFTPATTTGRDNMKTCIQKNGALFTAFHNEDGNHTYYSADNSCYYYPSSSSALATHAVTIVGWDDNYSASNFPTAPPGDGAWIVKNSYGTGWGNEGYFYLSYYSAMSYAASFQMEIASKHDKIYQYTNSVVGTSGNTDENYGTAIANIFTAEEDDNIYAVSFFTDRDLTGVTVYLYNNTDVSGGNPINGKWTSGAGHIVGDVSRGYHTITLSTPVEVKKDETFSVEILTKTTDSALFYYDTDENLPGVSYCGKYNTSTLIRSDWTPLMSGNTPGVFYIKAFSKKGVLLDGLHFTENNFRTALGNIKFDKDKNKILSDDEINDLTTFEWKQWSSPYKGSLGYNLSGIKYLTNLETLTLTNVSAVALDLSQNSNLKTVTCTDCGIHTEELTSDYIARQPIDVSKILKITGGEIRNGRIIPTSTEISYVYDCGNDFYATFHIIGDTFIPEEETFIPGDADESGKIDILDVITINRAILSKETLSNTQLKAADINGNEKPDSSDSLLIMKYIVGLVTDLTA